MQGAVVLVGMKRKFGNYTQILQGTEIFDKYEKFILRVGVHLKILFSLWVKSVKN